MRRGRRSARGGGAAAMVPGTSTALAVQPVRPPRLPLGDAGTIQAEGQAVGELDAVIARRREELAVLERAKEIVLRG